MKVTFEIGDRVEMTHVKSASGQKLAERKYGNDPEKVDEAMKERERIAENFKQAKEGIEKSYK